MPKFGPGDVVRLNSGGPDLTVTLYEEHKKAVYVKWVGEGGAPQSDSFPDACLTLVKGAFTEVKGISDYDRVQLNG